MENFTGKDVLNHTVPAHDAETRAAYRLIAQAIMPDWQCEKVRRRVERQYTASQRLH